MRVLAIGAHPDDIEIFMIGILLKLKQRGDKIFTCIATNGALGGNINNLSKIRKEEASKGLKQIGKPIFLNLPDGSLGYKHIHIFKIEKLIKDVSPDLIITHFRKDYHSDHRNLSKIVKNIACHYIPILYCDTMLGFNFNPNYYVDITDFFPNKKKAILCHKSQNPDRFYEMVKIVNAFRAIQCNLLKNSYVEAFKFEKSFPFHDIRTMLPPSPIIRKFDIQNSKGFL